MVLGVLLQNSVSDAFVNRRRIFTGRAATKMTDKFSSALLHHPNDSHDEDKSLDESEIEGLVDVQFNSPSIFRVEKLARWFLDAFLPLVILYPMVEAVILRGGKGIDFGETIVRLVVLLAIFCY